MQSIDHSVWIAKSAELYGKISVAADSSIIQGIAGAASIAGSVGGKAGVSVSIGLSLAFNRVDNRVEAFIANADQGVTTTTGDVVLSATSQGPDPIDLGLQRGQVL